MTPEEEKIAKSRVHLIGEAFPEHFTMTFYIKRLENGELEPNFACMASPQNVTEHRILHHFLSCINPSAFQQ